MSKNKVFVGSIFGYDIYFKEYKDADGNLGCLDIEGEVDFNNDPDGIATICVDSNLSNKERALTYIHELLHIILYLIKEKKVSIKTIKQEERFIYNIERFIEKSIKKFDFFEAGIIEIQRGVSEKKDK